MIVANTDPHVNFLYLAPESAKWIYRLEDDDFEWRLEDATRS